MKEIKFDPFAVIANVAAAASPANSKSIYISSLDNTRQVKATLTTSGDFFGATFLAKFQDAADDSTWADVTGGGFANQTEPGTETITFTLGSNVHVGTQQPNYGKFLSFWYDTSGGDSGGTTAIDVTVTIEDIFLPQQTVTMKLYPSA